LPGRGGLRRLLRVRRSTHYAREEVPEVLNITPATAAAATAQTADANATQAAMRPLAGFGAGAFVFAGAWVGSAFASPRAGAFGAVGKASVVDVIQVDSVQRHNHNFIQTARLYPVTKGGVGPHPAREPEPV
jgi:hypothetical protein